MRSVPTLAMTNIQRVSLGSATATSMPGSTLRPTAWWPPPPLPFPARPLATHPPLRTLPLATHPPLRTLPLATHPPLRTLPLATHPPFSPARPLLGGSLRTNAGKCYGCPRLRVSTATGVHSRPAAPRASSHLGGYPQSARCFAIASRRCTV